MQETLESRSLTDRSIRERVEMGRRHELRDREFLRILERYLRPGSVLEPGASTGLVDATQDIVAQTGET